MVRKAHKILGLITGPLIFVWFISGMVMMYVAHPKAHQSSQNRLPRMAPLAADAISLNFQEAWLKTGMSETPAEARLNMLIHRPAYFFRSHQGSWKVVYADNGEVLNTVTPEMARQSASSYMEMEMDQADISSLDHPDQWTVGTGSGPGYPPFYKFQCNDGPGTWLYVSKTSGEVCQVTTHKERILVWLGSIPHWLYFTALRQHIDVWRQVILWLSGICTVAIALGLWIGITNFSWKGYGRNRYRRSSAFIGMKKWHHFLGLVFGLTTLAWTFSGMLSLSPLHWHSGTAPNATENGHMTGGDLTPSRFVVHPAEALNACQNEHRIRKIDLLRFDGIPYYLCWPSPSNSLLVRADASGYPPSPYLLVEDVVSGAQGLMPGSDVAAHTVLHQYDLYYVDKRGQAKLPVVKISFDDPSQTTYYINMYNGAIVKRYDSTARLNRWLYKFMHCFDIPFLLRHRFMRDSLMLLFLTGGTLLTATGIHSWVRRYRRKIKANRVRP